MHTYIIYVRIFTHTFPKNSWYKVARPLQAEKLLRMSFIFPTAQFLFRRHAGKTRKRNSHRASFKAPVFAKRRNSHTYMYVYIERETNLCTPISLSLYIYIYICIYIYTIASIYIYMYILSIYIYICM